MYAPKTKAQRHFLTNVERARLVKVTTSTCEAVYYAVLGGMSYCRFNTGDMAALTDEYLNGCIEYLYDKAVEANQQENIKWAGFEK